jgi:hypothetical protein
MKKWRVRSQQGALKKNVGRTFGKLMRKGRMEG